MSTAAAGVLRPASEDEARELLLRAQAERAAVLPCGNRTRLGRHLPRAIPAVWLSLAGLQRITDIRPADRVCEVEAGVSPAELRAALAPHGLQLGAAAPGSRRGTLGGLFLAPDHSLLTAACGPPRDQVLGARWLLADGTVVRTGAQVVKSVAGYDLTRLFLGTRGRLAACLSLILRLRPLPRRPRWYRAEAEVLRGWLAASPAGRPPLRLAFTLGDPRSPAWVQTDGLKPGPGFPCTEADPAAGGAALDAALEAFRRATHRVHLPPGRRESFRSWRRLAGGADAFDWLSATGSFSPRTPREEDQLRSTPAVGVIPRTSASPWLARVAGACAPGARPFQAGAGR